MMARPHRDALLIEHPAHFHRRTVLEHERQHAHLFPSGADQPQIGHLDQAFVGFFGSLEEVNVCLRSKELSKPRATPAHLL